MKKLNKFLLLLIAVSSFSVLSATENPLKNSAKVFGIASHKTLNDEMKPIAQMVFDARSARSQFQIQSPFKVSRVNENFDGGLKQSAILQLQRESLENILTEKPEFSGRESFDILSKEQGYISIDAELPDSLFQESKFSLTVTAHAEFVSDDMNREVK